MPFLVINCCKNFRINKITLCVKKKDNVNDSDFKLIKAKHKKYKKLLPNNKDYIFLKVLDDREIISVEGKLLKSFCLKKKDLLGKEINTIQKCRILFNDFILPLFYSCLENKTAYQFDFNFKDKKYSCSLYPCLIPDEIVSIDIVIRPSQNTVVDKNTDNFILI